MNIDREFFDPDCLSNLYTPPKTENIIRDIVRKVMKKRERIRLHKAKKLEP